MRDICDCCKKEKPWIITRVTKVNQGKCIASPDEHLCKKCYNKILAIQVESEEYNDPEMEVNYDYSYIN